MYKILPPILWLIMGSVIILIDILTNLPIFPETFKFFGVIFIVLGAAIFVITGRKFRKVKTDIHTFHKPSHLMTDGLFAYTRNPIYLGFTIALLGVVILANNYLALLPWFAFFLLCNFWYIPFEEDMATKTFGPDYEKYKASVRRWI